MVSSIVAALGLGSFAQSLAARDTIEDMITGLINLIDQPFRVGDRVPSDRPIDGLDMSAFILGQADALGRDTFVYMGSDGEPIAAKWKTFKVHFRYTESDSWIAPYIKPQIPMVCDLISDPHEKIDLMQSTASYDWVIGAAMAPLVELARSAKQYRHIQVGEEDFNGYD